MSQEVTSGSEYYIQLTALTAGTFKITFTADGIPPSTIDVPTTNVTQPAANTWSTNGNITAGGEQWFKFTATAAEHYIHFEPGTLSSVNVLVYNSTGSTIGSQTTLSSSSPSTSRTVTSDETYYVRVTASISSATGTYQIAFNASEIAPPLVDISAITATPLIANTWSTNGSITAGGEQWFKFTAGATTQYIHFDPGTLSSVYVQLYNSAGSKIGRRSDLLYGGSPSTSVTVTSGTEYYINVTTYNNTGAGAYKIAFNASTTPPGITLPIIGVTTLTASVWANGNIATSSDEEWFKFTASGASHYLHFEPGTLSYVEVQVYDNNGVAVGAQTSLSPITLSTSPTVVSGQTYYIRVKPSSIFDGAYRIAFNASSTPPPSIDTSAITATTLTVNAWSNGNIISGGNREEWFKFTATAASHYIHFNPGALSDVYVQLYNNAGVIEGSRTNLTSSTLNTSRTLTSGQTYYIKVTPFSSYSSGTYKIAFNTSTTTPSPIPITGVTTLTANTWSTNGNITAGGEQWFKFNATATPQYIHFDPGTALTTANVQLYDSTGTTVGSVGSLSSSTPNLSRPVTTSNEYYIKVTGSSNTSSGAYKIAFNTSATKPSLIPTIGVIPLTANTWSTNGSITAGGEQWFKFTATAASHYIHFEPGALSDVYIQLYDSASATVGTSTRLSTSTLSVSKTGLTSANEYYIKVTPYGTGSGAYKIAFNTLTTAPNITVPAADAIQLTKNIWTDRNITTAGGIEWFKFSATGVPQYIHIKVGTLPSAYIQLYDNAGATVGAQQSAYSGDNTVLRPVKDGDEYYIKVTASSSGGGTYKIAFSDVDTPPAITLPAATSLTANTWSTNGNITAANGVQWFKFTATATAQYIHFQTGTLSRVYVQVYDSTGATAGTISRLGSGYYYSISRTVTNANEYYISVMPDTNTDTGTYKIGFNTTLMPPEVPELTANTWGSGNIINAGGTGWHKFTAGGASQYIHFKPGTLTGIEIQLYDSTGATVESSSFLRGSTLSTSRMLTNATVYYIEVKPEVTYFGSGTYQIAFNASETAPAP
jgi:predicted RNA-binding protein with TRAM domain